MIGQSSPRRRGPRLFFLERLRREVFPLRIHLLDEPDLPSAVPLLESLLPLDRLVHAVVHLEVHERMHAVLLGKSVHAAVAMRFDTLGEIARDADVERSVRFTGEDVDDGLLHAGSNALGGARVDLDVLMTTIYGRPRAGGGPVSPFRIV